MHRAVAAHNLNEHSSRSHAICTVQMEQRLRPGVPLRALMRSASCAPSCTWLTWRVSTMHLVAHSSYSQSDASKHANDSQYIPALSGVARSEGLPT